MDRKNYAKTNFQNVRCRICNRVSHAEISDDFGDFSADSFYEESDGLGFICGRCHGEIEDVMTEYYIEDDLEWDDDCV